MVRWLCVILTLTVGAVASAFAQQNDPTRPPVDAVTPVSSAEAADIQLSQIIYSDLNKLALINDKRVKEGDRVGGFTVSEILPNKVYLNRSGERITLSVFQPLTELKSGAEQ